MAPAAASAGEAEPKPAESWEMVVGTSWLNKIGVFVFVIGLALLVGYSFARIGPLGRVAIGYALSAALLGAGVWLERKQGFRNYAFALIAGGWAGVYFTTFAMHDVPAARVIESDLLAGGLLFAVAGGMIGHSLRYRSQVVTALAFIVAYATLALSPVSGFSLAASVPLALSLLTVSQRLGWPGISALGIVATYGVFVLRGAVFPGGIMDPSSAIPYVTLAAYWLTFEAAELIGLRMRYASADTPADTRPVSMLALNAIGLVGTTLVVMPADDPALLSSFLFGSGVAYVASAVIRAWLMPDRRQAGAPDVPFDTAHAATAVAAALFAVAIDLRFSATRQTLALLLETQLLFVASLLLRDVWLRRFGSLVAVPATIHAWAMAVQTHEPGAAGIAVPVMVAVAMALAWYVNCEMLAQRALTPTWTEPAYSWAATALLFTASFLELSPAHQAVASLVLGVVLLEWGLRRGADFVLQCYLLGFAGAYQMIGAFLATSGDRGWIGGWGPAPAAIDEWTVLPSGIMLTAYAAWRLMTCDEHARAPMRLGAAAVSAALSTAFVLLFEWRVLAPNAVAPAWALTAVALTAAGAWRGMAVLRWQGYTVVLFAAIRAVAPLIELAPAAASESAAVLIVIASMYAISYLGRRSGLGALRPDETETSTREEGEAAVTAVLSGIATASFALWKYRVLPEVLVAPAWAATALALAVLGDRRQKPGQRRQGYALTGVAAAHVSLSLLDQTSVGASEAAWAAAVGGLSYASAWIATRHVRNGSDPAVVSHGLLGIGTAVVALAASRWFGDLTLGPVWAALGAALLALGLLWRLADLRWHGLALIALGALRAGRPVFGEADATTTGIAWLTACLMTAYVGSLATKRAYRRASAAGETRTGEDLASDAISIGTSALLAMLIIREVRPSMVTLALGLQGLGLMAAGLVTRSG
jgi:hypothetical protein